LDFAEKSKNRTLSHRFLGYAVFGFCTLGGREEKKWPGKVDPHGFGPESNARNFIFSHHERNFTGRDEISPSHTIFQSCVHSIQERNHGGQLSRPYFLVPGTKGAKTKHRIGQKSM
jgi:hypothetical protein